jgi:hypothetical protein
MYIYLCMLEESNIHIYACNKSSVYIYKYNKFKYTNYWCKIQLDLPGVCLNVRLNSRLARLYPSRLCRLDRFLRFLTV